MKFPVLKNLVLYQESFIFVGRIRSTSNKTAHYNSNESGHAFIADRYRRSRTVTVNYYSWVWDYIPPLTPVPDMEEKIEYTYSAPTITMIGMNWGWFIPFYATYNPNNEWFSLTGDWIIHGDSTDYNYNITRKMIYNFHPVNN